MVGNADRYGTLAQPVPMAQSGGGNPTPGTASTDGNRRALGAADPADHDHSALSGKRLETRPSAWQAGSTDDI